MAELNNKKPVGFELSSNNRICYEFGSFINPFSSMTTYVFLVWQTYFFFLIYANTFWKLYTHVVIQNIIAHEVVGDNPKYHKCFQFTAIYVLSHL